MSRLYGKWRVEDFREVIRGLDEKTGMNGASLSICAVKAMGKNGNTLGSYRPRKDASWGYFSFSLMYFDDNKFDDLDAIDVIRHEYCHYLVDALGLNEVFHDQSVHGIAWKTACGLLNTDQSATYHGCFYPRATDDSFMNAYVSDDIQPVNILEQIDRWGLNLPSIKRRKRLEKSLIRKYTKLRVFKAGDSVFHDKLGYGKVLDTFPSDKKQLLYVEFEQGDVRIVQNRKVYKVINGDVKRPVSKAV
jgi:hypothetical protein